MIAQGVGSRGNGTTKDYTSWTYGGGVVSAAQNNVITLSRSGYGDENLGQHIGTSWTADGGIPTLTKMKMSLNDPTIPGWAQDYVDDVEFINSIITPGSLWRWKEDPGGIIYKTKTPPFPIMGGIYSAVWSFNQNDYIFGSSGEAGVALFNHFD